MIPNESHTITEVGKIYQAGEDHAALPMRAQLLVTEGTRIQNHKICMLKVLIALVLALLIQLRASAQGSAGVPIEHFIFIIQENHSFDNYFGTYPGANGIPPGAAFADYPGGPLTRTPFLTTLAALPHDVAHIWEAAEDSYDNGAMDGWMWSSTYPSCRYYFRLAGLKVPQPNPNLVRIVPKTSSTPTPSTIAEDNEVLAPSGVMDDEDENAPDVETRNEVLAAHQATASATPPPLASWSKYVLSYYDRGTIPNYSDLRG